MKDLLSPFLAAWNDELSIAGTRSASPDAIALGDLPAFPLARSVKMPESHPYEAGALSLRLSELALSGASRLDPGRCSLERDGARIRLSLALAPLALTGRYAIMAKPDPVVPIDSAGGLMDLTPEQLAPVAAGQDPTDPPLDPQKEEWLKNARAQRVKLAGTENGQLLLGTYSEHSPTFEEVMRTNAGVVSNWQANGATKQMAGDTHVAVDQDDVVNRAKKTYAGDVTYNGNAFSQQLNIALGCLLTDPTFDINGTAPPAADSKYWAAAKAALAFGEGVNTSTGNTKNKVTEMKASHVYGTVDAHSGEPPTVADQEALQALTSGDTGGGRDYRPEPGWIVLDEDDRALLLRFKTDFLRHQAAKASITGKVLFEGSCGAQIGGIAIALDILLETDAGGRAAARAGTAKIDLPAFDFDIDDAGWFSDAGTIARQRLNRIQFVRTLLREAVMRALQRAAEGAAERACLAIAHHSTALA